MALGTHREYKTRDRDIRTALKQHAALTQRFMAEGLDKDTASKKAYREIVNWK